MISTKISIFMRIIKDLFKKYIYLRQIKGDVINSLSYTITIFFLNAYKSHKSMIILRYLHN